MKLLKPRALTWDFTAFLHLDIFSMFKGEHTLIVTYHLMIVYLTSCKTATRKAQSSLQTAFCTNCLDSGVIIKLSMKIITDLLMYAK